MGEAPRARSADLIIEELGDEVLVYDTKTDTGHSLSPEAAKVWRACDGTTSAERLSAKLGMEPEVVNTALEELSACDLLEVKPTIVADGSTRREVTLKLAKVGATVAAAPYILSVAAPTPAMAASLKFCIKFSSGNCGGNTGCSKSVGCCCCTPPLNAQTTGTPFPPGSPCQTFDPTAQQCKTCVPCPGTICPTFTDPRDPGTQQQCSAGAC